MANTSMELQRAYATLEIKSVDEDQRIITGIASTSELDRQGDVMESAGAKFTLPIPLLWQHKHDKPIGHVVEAFIKSDGIHIKARIEKGVLPFIDECWALIKSRLVRGLSIGWQPLSQPTVKAGAVHWSSWAWHELSCVTVPANASATIATVKSLDAPHLAASGRGASTDRQLPGVSGRSGTAMTNSERLTAKKADLTTKSARMNELLRVETEDGLELSAEQKSEYQRLQVDSQDITEQIGRLLSAEKAQAALATGVIVTDVDGGGRARAQHTVEVKDNTPPGTGFARYALCKAAAFLEHRNVLDVIKERYSTDRRLMTFAKASVPAGTTTEATWASPLVYAENLASEFIEYLRPQTIIGKFGQGGIPSLTRVPFNVRIMSETQPGNGYWVGEGAPKPLTSFGFAPVTLTYHKAAAISVITQELARFSSPSAEERVRSSLGKAIIARLDTDFVDPAHAAVANVSPASITNGLVAKTSAGTSADNARTDLGNLLSDFIEANIDPTSLVLIMPSTLALSLSLMVNSLGQKEFADLTMRGGSIMGIPVITSQYAANQSGGGNLVIAVNAADIFLADDGGVTIDASTEASLQMLDNPTNNSATATATQMVSMFQTNSIALRAERFITWKKARTMAVVYMDDVNWGGIGSPA